MNYAIGVDVGGSHITAGLIDLDKRLLVKNSLVRKSVNSDGTVDEIFAIWTKVISEVLKKNTLNVVSIGIAMPGPFDYTNGISWMNAEAKKFESLYGMNLKNILSEKLKVASSSISFRNDAESFLAGEMMCGAGRNYKKAIGVTLGTGLGTAFHNDGKTIDVNLGMTLPFLDSVVEEYISTRWCVKRYFELTGKTITGAKDLTDDLAHDKIAKDIFLEFRKNLLSFLTIFIERDVPEVVICGGNISNALINYFAPMQLELRKKFPNIAVRKAQLGENAALIGAAASLIR